MIEIKHLYKSFETSAGTVEALKDINLTIEDGDIYGIIGMSGAGKSTLLMNIKEEVAEQKLPCHSYDNLVDGGNHLGAILGGYGEEGDDLALGVSLFTSSEGEEIKGNISRESRLYKSFLELGYYNNRDYKFRRIFKDEDEDENKNI